LGSNVEDEIMNRAWALLGLATVLLTIDLIRSNPMGTAPARDPGAARPAPAASEAPARPAGPGDAEVAHDDVEGLRARARARSAEGRLSEALEDLEHAASHGGENEPGLLVERGSLYRQFGRFDEALDDLNRALELEPDHPEGHFQRGAVYYHLRDYEAALADFDRCVRAEPESAPPYFNRALTRAALHRMAEARSDLESFLRLSKDAQWNEEARRILDEWEAMSR
jgi:tetratricopeptide (TPR) repeat protein